MTQTQPKSRGCTRIARRATGGTPPEFSDAPSASSQLADPPEPDSLSSDPSLPQLGTWELVEQVAEGSWARIYRARPAGSPPDAPATYALKTLRPDRQEDPCAVALLAREAFAGRSVSHPHLIAILETRVTRTPSYLVMPWMQGSTLKSRLEARAYVDLPMALWIARQTAEALDALHTAGWMHGDIKPGNILLSPEGHATLLDLGFARRLEEANSIVDRWLMGTFNYLAPEYFASKMSPDVRSDIYSLGVVLFELLTGELPFHGRDAEELAAEHKHAVPPDLRALAPHLPPQVIRMVRRMLSKDPFRRPQTPRELIERLIALEIATFSERAVA